MVCAALERGSILDKALWSAEDGCIRGDMYMAKLTGHANGRLYRTYGGRTERLEGRVVSLALGAMRHTTALGSLWQMRCPAPRCDSLDASVMG